jgi:hypothetical protein
VLPARPFSVEILSGRDRATGLTLADALIDRLGRFPANRRQAYARSLRYANTEKSLSAVGRSLRVEAVLATTFARTVTGSGWQPG